MTSKCRPRRRNHVIGRRQCVPMAGNHAITVPTSRSLVKEVTCVWRASFAEDAALSRATCTTYMWNDWKENTKEFGPESMGAFRTLKGHNILL